MFHHRHDVVPGFVQGGAHEVVHGGIDDGEILLLAGLQVFDAGQQHAGIPHQAAPRFEDHLESPAREAVEKGRQVGGHGGLLLPLPVADAEAAAQVQVANGDAVGGQPVDQGENAVQRLGKRRGIE